MANTALGESSSTSGAPNSSLTWKYDVFLSSSGEDTVLKFTDHLYHALTRHGIRTFRDDEGLQRGEVISTQLIQAIKDSRCAVVVLSQKYADSKWCLNELQQTLESRKEMGGRVFPIFYDVDPSDVRNQRKRVGEALANHEKRLRGDTGKTVQIWRNSLSEIGNMIGWDARSRPQAQLIEEVVGEVWKYLCSKLPFYDNNLVGIERRMVDLMSCLEIGLDDIRVVGIWGMGGAGKTTLARVVYEKISDRFEICSFLPNVRETLQTKGLVYLQKRLLFRLRINAEIHDDHEGMDMIRKHFYNKKVLLVLDDLDCTTQFEKLAESLDWFGKGSKIIITTRNKHVLTSCEAKIYEMKVMEEDESLQLFSKEAFKKDVPEEDYLELSKSVVAYAGGLPLALSVLGSFLFGRSKVEWIDIFSSKQILNENIHQILKISYDGLNEKEKTIFLDIACFFRGWRKDVVTQVLKGCDLNPTIEIQVLIERTLLVERESLLGYPTLEMHVLFEELGRDIIRQESFNASNRSRLWEFENIKEVLENNTGSEAIQVIVMQPLYGRLPKVKVHPEAFSKMNNIRLLIIEDRHHALILPRGLKFSSALKVVCWRQFPLETLPLPLDKLVHIEMQDSKIKKLWNGEQHMEKLKRIDLSDSHSLIETPNFLGVPNLEYLNLSRCVSLVMVHSSLGELKRLVEINLKGCRNLEILPRRLESNFLERLDLHECGKVAVLPKFGEGMNKLSYLDVSNTAMTTLPESLGSLTGLRYLDLGGCRILDLDKLKTPITCQISSLDVTSLTELCLNWCGLNDGSILDNIGGLSSLIALDLGGNDFVNLPTGCFSGLFGLLYLFLDDCKRLKSLPSLSARLIRLSAAGCDSMEPLSDRQSWNLVASRDHEYRGRIEYVNTDERRDDDDVHDAILLFKNVKSEYLPQRDFVAIMPAVWEIPSWCTNKEYYPLDEGRKECEIKVDIPQHFRESEWLGIVVCLHFSGGAGGMWWSSKGAEDADYIRKDWAHVIPMRFSKSTNPQLCCIMMVLELNEKTCWQHLTPHNNSLHILLSTFGSQICPPSSQIWGCGWRVICKEEMQVNVTPPPLLPTPHHQVMLSQRLLREVVRDMHVAERKQIAVWRQSRARSPAMANTVQGESSATSCASNSTPTWKYDVFLSFRGEDTRLNFTDHLYHALKRSGITAYRDDEELERGQVISPQRIQSIKDSLCAVVVLSENYAKSTWCLDELQKILESMNGMGRPVFPIFYEVDPSDVRHQIKSFVEALAEHENTFRKNVNKVQNWKNALSEIGKLSGWKTRNQHEANLIADVVGKISRFTFKVPSYDDNLVNIQPRMIDLMPCLEIGRDNVCLVGIWGMSGAGKTTLARVVFEKISDEFEVCCFLPNVGETLRREGLVSLQKKIISHLRIRNMKIYDDHEGMSMMIRQLFCNKKVLLVLDDLDHTSQLKNLTKSPNWFGKGSRIIITTRDMHVLTSTGGKIYRMRAMEKDESLQLFSKIAFKKDHPEKDYLELSESVVAYAGGLPLALKVLGSFLCKRSEDEWTNTLDRLKQIEKSGVLDQILKMSYDGLNEKEKTIFLDIACFFRGWMKHKVNQVLEGCDLNPTNEKILLVETKHLWDDPTLEMHDLLEDLGRNIIHRESPNVGKRSRLWEFEDIKEVLENNTGSEAIQAIVMQDYWNSDARIKVHPEAFSKLNNIRLLILSENIDVQLRLPRELELSSLQCPFSALKVVRWPSFPFETLPLPLHKLVDLQMPSSKIKKLWNGIEFMKKLKRIDLSYSNKLIETPDFSGVPYLEQLILLGCEALVEVHPSLGELIMLVKVDLSSCENLEILPSKLETNSLERLDLSCCGKVAMLPEIGEGMEKLSYLDVSDTAITTLPKSLGSLTGLGYLDLSDCKIPDLGKLLKISVTRQIYGLNLTSLTELYLRRCGLNDGSIPDNLDSLSSLIVLDLRGNDFVNLPTGCFSSLFRLLYLFLDGCKRLKSLPWLPARVIRLSADSCDSMEPLSDEQLWNLVVSRDHEYRGRTEYVKSYEMSSDIHPPFFMLEHVKPEFLPQRDFLAIIPGCEIPSWYTNKEYYPLEENVKECEIKVEIPQHFRESEWLRMVVCLHVSGEGGGIWWSSKGAEDDDYICKEWGHVIDPSERDDDETRPKRCIIMVLELNEKTCWQHLTSHNNSLHILLSTSESIGGQFDMKIMGCGWWRVIRKEEMPECCILNHFTQPPLLAPPRHQVMLSETLLDQVARKVWGKGRRQIRGA
ncbi:uncharacterized protein LOC129303275 isoform X2 [Prosopis cineraria]|uniref:uncharacterized protein LOC129303275 isoform X2 n=1 Tax=Prosopis cineraria TaxID=364024 RepID=UPI00240FC1C4|nr:uncharacterized protein LOC129303275 isoform X2 [Prosopis cineraria]